MKPTSLFPAIILFCFSLNCAAAKVEYNAPNVSITAVEESLTSVMQAVGKTMQISVTIPNGINPTINCDIRNKPVKYALKQLLGDLSYSLEWADGGERLVGLTILAGSGNASLASSPANNSRDRGNSAAAIPAPANAPSSRSQNANNSPGNNTSRAGAPDGDVDMAEREAEMELERAEREAEMAESRREHEEEMALRRQEEEIEHEAKMREEIARKEAESQALFEMEAARRP